MHLKLHKHVKKHARTHCLSLSVCVTANKPHKSAPIHTANIRISEIQETQEREKDAKTSALVLNLTPKILSFTQPTVAFVAVQM